MLVISLRVVEMKWNKVFLNTNSSFESHLHWKYSETQLRGWSSLPRCYLWPYVLLPGLPTLCMIQEMYYKIYFSTPTSIILDP